MRDFNDPGIDTRVKGVYPERVCYFQPYSTWGEGEGEGKADFTLPQIAFFITSIKDAVGPQNLAIFTKI